MDITFAFYQKLKEEGGVTIHFIPDKAVQADIISLKEHADMFGIDRTPFSVIFFVKDATVYPQQIYTIETKDKQFFEVFLVPIGPSEGGMRYEAVYG